MLSVEVCQGNLYSSRFLFCELALTVKRYAGRALRRRVFLLNCSVWCLAYLHRVLLGITRMSTDSKEPAVEVSQFQRLQRFLQSSTFDARLGKNEGKLPTKSAETWAVVSWLDCWAGILEQKISQRRQGSTRSWQWVVYVNLCRLPPQTGWTRHTPPDLFFFQMHTCDSSDHSMN